MLSVRILTNRQLAAIAAARPSSLSGLGAIDGIGPARLQRYGRAILRILGVPVLEVEAETAAGPAGTKAPRSPGPAADERAATTPGSDDPVAGT